ncbi:MAG: hypothetical protein ACLTBR_00200 [Anaerostipes sp.]|uniref:hypothetical protein n=1 Tax=Anaerostipes sp. TaxID=1872530 RepID=UPI003993F222
MLITSGLDNSGYSDLRCSVFQKWSDRYDSSILNITSEHFMLDGVTNQMLINQAFFLLTGLHKTFLTDAINTARNPRGLLINVI